MRHYTLFISDLHLESGDPESARLFYEFLHKEAGRADALYILGDFFEYWIGDDDPSSFNQSVKEALRQFAQSASVYIMTGNRDFLLGRRFIVSAGCIPLADPSSVTVYNKPVVLAHGDKLCTDDKLHQWFRWITNINWVQKLFCWLPLKWRRYIANKLRRVSKRHHGKLAEDSLDASDHAVRDLLDKYNSHLLIHGHTHMPDVHYHELDGISGKRLVMGAWHDKADIVRLYADGESELVPLKPDTEAN